MSADDWRFFRITTSAMAIILAVLAWQIARDPPRRPFAWVSYGPESISPTPY